MIIFQPAVLLLLISWFLASLPSAIGGEPAAPRDLALKGRPGVAPCAQCHGANGEGQVAAGFPRLAGLPREYLAKQLHDFRAGRRKNPVMAPIAMALDAPAIDTLSAYYADLKAAPPTTLQAGSVESALGARIAQRGNWDKDVPACFACHGESGSGVPPHFPSIANQPASYTAKQLRDWKSGERANDPNALMKSVAARLSEEEIDSVAAYLQNLRTIAR